MRWMRMSQIQVVLILGTVLTPFAAPAQEASPTRVAVVNFQEALLATDEMQARSKELETKYTPRREDLERLAQELQELQEKLQSAAGAEAVTMQSEFQRKQRNAQRMQEDFQADAEFDRNEILGAAARAMREVISELAAAKGLDMIVDVSNTLFFKPSLDLSAEATAAYNRKKQAQ